MNWTLSFLGKSDKLVIGQHLLLSPVSTAVEPAYSEFDHRPHPIQEGEVAMLSDVSQVDVMLGLWKNIGLISIELTSMRFLGS